MPDKVKVLDMKGTEKSEISVNWFVRDKGEQALHLAITSYLASVRAGTASTKSRNQVNLTGKKPYKQKGTGRARAGTASSPIWKGGGVAFGPKPRKFTKKINKKVRQLALKRALSQQFDQQGLIVIDELKFPKIKTKLAVEFLTNINANNKAVIVIDNASDKNTPIIERSFSNLPNILLINDLELNSYDTLLGQKIIFTKQAFLNVADRFHPSEKRKKEKKSA